MLERDDHLAGPSPTMKQNVCASCCTQDAWALANGPVYWMVSGEEGCLRLPRFELDAPTK
jgi:hypothetical protein